MIIKRLIANIGIDKVTHFFVGATIALSITLILCFVGSISKVIPYSILGTYVSVLCGLAKAMCDSEFNREDFLATMLGGIIAIVISLFSLL